MAHRDEENRGRSLHPDRRPTANGTPENAGTLPTHSNTSTQLPQRDEPRQRRLTAIRSPPTQAPSSSTDNSRTMALEAQSAARQGNAAFGDGYMTGIGDGQSISDVANSSPSPRGDGGEDSGEDAEFERTSCLASPPPTYQQATAVNSNGDTPIHIPDASRIRSVPCLVPCSASDPESEASPDPPRSTLPLHARTPLAESAADAGFSSEADYVRHEALRGGISGLHSNSAPSVTSDSDGLMMRPSSRLRGWQNANGHVQCPSPRGITRSVTPLRTPTTRSTVSYGVSRWTVRAFDILQRSQRREERTRERRAMQRFRLYATLGDTTAQQSLALHAERLIDWHRGDIHVFANSHPTRSSTRVEHGFSTRFARRYVELLEQRRRDRSGILLSSVDDHEIVSVASVFAPIPNYEEWSIWLPDRTSRTLRELIASDTVEPINDDASVREGGWAWSSLPRNLERADQSLDSSMSAISQREMQVEPSHQGTDLPPLQRQQRDSAVEQQDPAPSDLPPEVQHLAHLSCDPAITDGIVAAELRTYFRMQGILPASTAGTQSTPTSQTTPRGPSGLQFGDAPYIEASDQHLRSDAVRHGVLQWQQRNQRSERSSSRQPAGQGPQHPEGRCEEPSVLQRDSVTRDVVHEDKRKQEDGDGRNAEEAAV